MSKPRYRDEPAHEVAGWVLVSALRYALGRQTYIADMTIDLISEHWADIHPTEKVVILNDLRRHCEDTDFVQAAGYTGHDTDQWLTLYHSLKGAE